LISCTHAQEITLKECPLSSTTIEDNMDCGYLTVLENRDNPNSRRIKLAYLVLKATSPNPKPDPIVYLQGGPGGATLATLSYWRNSILRKDRDFILIDQRGTGFSEAVCTNIGSQLIEILAMNLTPEQEYEELAKVAATCKKEIKKEGLDLAGYNTIANAQDLDELRKSLGYDQWNLFGGSYGSRLALAYMRDFPTHSRAAILSALFPPQVNLYEHFTSNFKDALYKVFTTCAENIDCNRKYPDLQSAYFAALQGLRDRPFTFTMDDGPFTLNAQDMLLFTHQLLYSRNTIAQIPAFVRAIREQDEVKLSAAVQTLTRRAQQINFAMNWSFNAYDEIGFSDPIDYIADLKENPTLSPGLAYFNSDVRILKEWHAYRGPAKINEPVTSSIPSLVSNGAFDPITPPANARATMNYLSNHYYIEFANEGHALFSNCYFQMVEAFLNNPAKQPDVSCVAEGPQINWD
jgi:pimeloyl-ACP methyl ester carboxylesterase